MSQLTFGAFCMEGCDVNLWISPTRSPTQGDRYLAHMMYDLCCTVAAFYLGGGRGGTFEILDIKYLGINAEQFNVMFAN
jgi:hypothetical protein